MNNNLDIYQINTTAWDEEDFLLLTSLTPDQITNVIQPIVDNERELEKEMFKGTINDDTLKQWGKVNKYNNDSLVDALRKAYPNDTITHYIPNNIELISI